MVSSQGEEKCYEKKNNDNLPISHQLFIGDIPDNVTSENLKDFSICGVM